MTTDYLLRRHVEGDTWTTVNVYATPEAAAAAFVAVARLDLDPRALAEDLLAGSILETTSDLQDRYAVVGLHSPYAPALVLDGREASDSGTDDGADLEPLA